MHIWEATGKLAGLRELTRGLARRVRIAVQPGLANGVHPLLSFPLGLGCQVVGVRSAGNTENHTGRAVQGPAGQHPAHVQG